MGVIESYRLNLRRAVERGDPINSPENMAENNSVKSNSEKAPATAVPNDKLSGRDALDARRLAGGGWLQTAWVLWILFFVPPNPCAQAVDNLTDRNNVTLNSGDGVDVPTIDYAPNAIWNNYATITNTQDNLNGMQTGGGFGIVNKAAGVIDVSGASATGMYIASASDSDNYGTITTHGTTSRGVFLTSTGSGTNYGSITLGSTGYGVFAFTNSSYTNAASGVITTHGYSAMMSQDGAVVINNGSIIGTVDFNPSYGLGMCQSWQGGSVTNNGSITVTGPGVWGIRVTSSSSGTGSSNTGTLTATGDTAVGLYLDHVAGTFSNSGTVSVSGASADAVQLYQGFTFTNTGTLSSAEGYAIKANETATVNLQPGTRITRGTVYGSSTAVLNLSPGAGETFTFAMSGFSQLNLSSAGTYKPAGSFTTKDVSLSGTSILDIGANTITSTGTYGQGATSTLMVSVNGTTNGSILVTGTAAAVSGYSLVLNVSNYIPNNATYTIINGTGGTGVAAPAIAVIGNNHATFAATAIGEDLILTASRASNVFASDATDPNASAVGNVLDSNTNPTGDMLNVFNILEGLSDSQVGTALNTMTPDVSSGTMNASRTLNNRLMAAVNKRLNFVRNGLQGLSTGDMFQGTGLWMQALGNYEHQGERQGIQGYHSSGFGTMIGIDKILDKHIRLGLAAGYGHAGVNSKTPGSPSSSIGSWQGTLYGSYDSLDLYKARKERKYSRTAVRNQGQSFWYVDSMINFTQDNYDSRREIWLGSDHRVAKAGHYGQQYSASLEAGYTMVLKETKALEITPYTSLGYDFLYMNQYKENGADSLNLNVSGEGYNALVQGLGLKLAYPLVSERSGTFIPSIKCAWLYDYIGARFETTAAFAGGGPAFNTYGAKPAKSGMLIGAEIAFLNKGNMTLTANYDLELKDQYISNTYYGTARYDF